MSETQNLPARQSLVTKFATKYSIEPAKLLDILKATAFKQGQNDPVVSNDEMAALLVVADQHGLNPFTREIFAFKDKYKGIVPVVSVDGWSRIVNEHPEFDGVEFIVPETTVKVEHGNKPAFEWIECVIYRKDRTRPIRVREYLDETYQAPRGERQVFGPWQSHPRRFLRHKAFIQCARIAFSFAGIYDEDEAQRILDAGAIEGAATRVPERSATSRMHQQLGTGTGGQPAPETLKVTPTETVATERKVEQHQDEQQKVAETHEQALTPTLAALETRIDAMTKDDPNEAQAVLALINRHTNQAEQRTLMQRWNQRVMAMKGMQQEDPPAQKTQDAGNPPAGTAGKEKGSAQRLGRLKLQLADVPDLGSLDEILDLAREFEWTADQQRQITEAGDAARKRLTPG